MAIKYYKKISLSNFEVIQKKTLEFVIQQGILDTKTIGFCIIKYKELLDYCPELQESMNEIGLTIIGSGVYRTVNNNNPIHIDLPSPGPERKCRLNLPLLNYEGSSTLFFEADAHDPFTDSREGYQSHKQSFIPCSNAVEVDRVTIDQPTIIRVDMPHQVQMNVDHSPRLVLTLRCLPDPFELL